MQRDLSVIIGVIGFIIVVAVLLFSSNNGNGLSLSDTNQLPTGLILGATETQSPATTQPTVTTTPPLITSGTPTVTATLSTTPTPRGTTSITPTTQTATCKSNATFQKAKILANQFMSKHKIKAGYEVLQLISPPESDDDIEKLSYWMGEDDPNQTIQLYQTTSTSYTTVSFTLDGLLLDRGDHKEIRGTKRCELSLHEKRSSIDPEGVARDNDVLLYLDFSLSMDGELVLTAFKDSRNGTKYSGFD